jgi:hypothetical protein
LKDIFNQENQPFKPKEKNWTIYKYRVTFEPETQSRLLKQDLIRQHDYLFKKCKAFDGVNLYAFNKLNCDVRIESGIKLFK